MTLTLHRLLSAALLLTGMNAMATEEPKFTVLLKEGAIELRQYAPLLIAEAVVEGDMDEASNRGFRLIADFIFGNNQAPGDAASSAKIAMTAPVTVVPDPPSQKIAMTAPVTVAPADPGASPMVGKRWRVHFVMPSQYTLATLPKPKNPAVTLREVPAKRYAVLTYSGFNTEARIQQRSEELRVWLQARQLSLLGSAQLARYDPPWTLPMWRRNEIMFEIATPGSP
jgi:SOUL heme-binding protein